MITFPYGSRSVSGMQIHTHIHTHQPIIENKSHLLGAQDNGRQTDGKIAFLTFAQIKIQREMKDI